MSSVSRKSVILQTKRANLWTQSTKKVREQTGRVAVTYIHYQGWKDSSWGPAVCTGSSTWWWPRGLGWGHGKEAQGRGDMCICTADSHCSTAETSTTSQSKYPPIEKKKVIISWWVWHFIHFTCWSSKSLFYPSSSSRGQLGLLNLEQAW